MEKKHWRVIFPSLTPRPPPKTNKTKKKKKKKFSEASDLSEGAVRLAVLQLGEAPTGSNKPAEGDFVAFHLEVRRAPKEGHGGGGGGGDEPPLFSTRGNGTDGVGAPFVALLGPRGAPHRLPRAWELALADSTPGTRLAVRCSGALYGWGGETCGVLPPTPTLLSTPSTPSLSSSSAALSLLDPKGDYLYDLQLLRFYPSDDVVGVPLRPPSLGGEPCFPADDDESGNGNGAGRRSAFSSFADASGNPAAFKLTLEPGTTWESPRPPFEVSFALSASAPSSDGRLGKGEVFWRHQQQQGGDGDGKGKAPAGSPSSSIVSSDDGGLITATMGDGSLPEALEAALSCVCKGETAVVSLPLAALARENDDNKNKKRPLAFSLPSPVPPAVSASPRVELTLRLARMVQIRDLVGPATEGGRGAEGGGKQQQRRQRRGRVTKKRVREGRGEFPADCPLGDCAVRVHVRAVALIRKGKKEGEEDDEEEEVEGEVLWDTREPREGGAGVEASSSSSTPPPSPPPPFEFVIGTGAAPDAVDLAVCLMTPGEVSVVDSDWAHARFGGVVGGGGAKKAAAERLLPAGLVDDDGNDGDKNGESSSSSPSRPPSRPDKVRFELELVDFDAPDRDPPPEARLRRSEELRAQGNAVLSSGVPRALELAAGKYKRAATLLQSALDFDTEEQHEAAARGRAAANANLAAVALRRGAWGDALEACGKALDDEPRHAKALFRRATALASLGRFSEADEAFGLAEEADPGAAADVARERARVAARRRRAGEKQRREMSGFL